MGIMDRLFGIRCPMCGDRSRFLQGHYLIDHCGDPDERNCT